MRHSHAQRSEAEVGRFRSDAEIALPDRRVGVELGRAAGPRDPALLEDDMPVGELRSGAARTCRSRGSPGRSRAARARQRQISWRTSGARPSVASSRISSRGSVTRARPIASICCSPPESWLPRCVRRSRRRGNSSKTRRAARSRGRRRSPSPRARSNALRCSSTVRLAKICRPSGTRPRPRRAMRCAAPASTGSPRNTTSPLRAGCRPQIVRTSVVLPMPLRPSSADDLAGADVQVDAVQHLAAAVAGVQAAHREQASRQRCGRAMLIPRRGRPRSRRRRGAPPRARRWR